MMNKQYSLQFQQFYFIINNKDIRVAHFSELTAASSSIYESNVLILSKNGHFVDKNISLTCFFVIV